MHFFRSTYKSCSDEELMLLTKKGKTKAFEELYERYQKRMHFYFYRMFNGDSDLADDFLQDLFLKVIEKPHLFEEGKKFSTWLYSIASNMCKNEYRRLSVRKEVKIGTNIYEQFKEDEDASFRFDQALLESDLASEIKHLDDECREIIILRFQEGLSIKEISAIIECPEGTVKSRIFYTIKKLSEKLKAYKH